IASQNLALAISKDEVITMDMGGTSCDVGIIVKGKQKLTTAYEIEFGLPASIPLIDVKTIGAGGGSIAWVNAGGFLEVGPRSAGAIPGPACYGLGGQEPTVTDANLRLGYLDPDFFLGGRMRLDPTAAAAAMSHLAEPLGLSALEVAWGVYTIVCENMAAAARVHIVEKGRDPRRYAMVGFGGAGPAHAARVPPTPGARGVVIPPASGAAAAPGFLLAPLSFQFVHALPR